MAYSQLPIDEAPVGDLKLDLSNHRFPVDQPTESAAMNYLFAVHDVMSVARIILRDGYVDNELPLVVRENEHLIILEGNRRLSALRALLDPSLVPSHQTELDRLLRRYAPEARELPETIRVMCFPDREAAAPVLARLHIGESKKAWSLDEQAKFVRAQLTVGVSVEVLKEQLPAIKDVVRLIRMGHMREMLRSVAFRDPDLAEYATSDRLAMSSFEFAYRNPNIQAAIGVAFDGNGNLISRTSTAGQVSALERLLRGFKAGELNTRRGLKQGSEELRRLLDEMRGVYPDSKESVTGNSPGDPAIEGTSPTSTSPAQNPPSSNGDRGEHAPPPSAEPKRRGPHHPETRHNLDFARIDENSLPLPLKHRVRELRRIDVTEFPAGAAMLMRSVIEAAIKEHYGMKSGQE